MNADGVYRLRSVWKIQVEIEYKLLQTERNFKYDKMFEHVNVCLTTLTDME